jgi:hypothetical protein
LEAIVNLEEEDNVGVVLLGTISRNQKKSAKKEHNVSFLLKVGDKW